MQIKDSGERTEFASGALRDMHAGKGRMDLLPWAAIIEVSKHCEAGALKYGEHNVDRGIPTHSLLDSAMRHAAKYLDGQEDEDHLLAAAWNLLWAVEMREKHPECVDTPWRRDEEVTQGTEGGMGNKLHASWIYNDGSRFHSCSNCGHLVSSMVFPPKCDVCGANMDGIRWEEERADR